MRNLRYVLGFLLVGGGVSASLLAACGKSAGDQSGSGGGTGGAASAGCQAGTFRACTCDAGGTGTQTCATDGSAWEACSCSSITTSGGGSGGGGPGTCGDGRCSHTETCTSCPADCGDCPACTLAPTCTGAASVPASPMALASFNNDGQTMYSSGVPDGSAPGTGDCSDPLLRMRLSQIQIHKNGAPCSLDLFCMVQADDGQSSQLMVTPPYDNLSDGNPPLLLAPAAGTFWGDKVGGVKLSQFNITVTYQCFMVTTPNALQEALGAIAGVAGAAAGIPGNPFGWAFGVGGAAAAAAAAAAASGSGATPLLNVQQTIDASSLLALTNGDTWVVDQTGSTDVDGDCDLFENCDWDWELDIEAWGCAAPKGQQPM